MVPSVRMDFPSFRSARRPPLAFVATALLLFGAPSVAALSLNYPDTAECLAHTALTPLPAAVAGATPGVPVAFAVTNGRLPAGLDLRADGAVVGTPTEAGTFTVRITATNGAATASDFIWLNIRTVTVTYALPLYVVGQPVESMPHPLLPPVISRQHPDFPTSTLAHTGGALPPGLSFNGDFSLAGTPTTAGVYTFELTATNGPNRSTRSFVAIVTPTDLAAAPRSAFFSDPGVERFRPAASTGDYYVDSVRGDDRNDGRTPATAWQRLAKIPTGTLQPGNVIHLARGSHWDRQTLYLRDVQGTRELPVVVQAYGTGAPPTISDSYPPWSTTQRYPGVYLSGRAEHVVVLDLRIQDNRATEGIMVGPETRHIVVAGNEILRCYSGLSTSGDHATIVSNYIHDIHVPGEKECGVGIWFCGSGTEIGWNRIAHCRSLTGDSVGGGALEFYGYRSSTGFDFVSDGIRIHHNLLLNNANFMEMYGNASRLVVDHNLYLLGAHFAFLPHWDNWGNASAFGHKCTYDLLVANNTFVARPDPQPVGWGFFTLLWDDRHPNHRPDPASNALVVRNNIFVTNSTIAARNPLGEAFVHEHNLLHFTGAGHPGGTAYPLHPSEVIADPLFRAAFPGDVRLTAASPARDAAVAPFAAEDLLRAPLGADGAPDLGVYEYDPAPRLQGRLALLERPGVGEFVFGPTVAGRSYRVHTCTDLAAGRWLPLGEVLPGTGGHLTVVDPEAAGPRKFYRAEPVTP